MTLCTVHERKDIAYPTIVNVIADLHTRGFYADFNLLGEQLFYTQFKCFYSISQFDVLEFHCFENEVNPDEETVVYAIECFDSNVKGILLQMYNESLQSIRDILLRKISKFWK